MIRILTIIFLTAALLSPAWAGNEFEGEFHMTNETVGADGKTEISKITFFVKGNKLVLNTGKEGEKVILDVVTGDIYTITQQGGQPTVIKLNVSVINQIGGIAAFTGNSYGYTGDDSDARFKATGKSKTINGYTCKQYIISDGNDKGELWMAQDFPYDFTALINLFNLGKSWGDNPSQNVMPLEGNTTDGATGQTTAFNIEVVKKDLSDDVFELPANAQVVDMTMMLKNMLENSDPEAVKKMLEQMMPKN